MSEHKQAVWFADDPISNRFFFCSPFRSWKFIVNTAVLVAFLVVCAIVLAKNWSSWSTLSKFFWAVLVMLQGAVYPYLRVLQSHRKINKLYLAGKITAQPAGTSIDELLNVTDNALNDGIYFGTVVMGILVVFGFLIPLK